MRRGAILFFGVFISFVSACAMGQVQQEWVMQYHGEGSGADWGKAIEKDSLGNIIVVSMSNSWVSQLHWSVIKYDPSGQKLWSKTLTHGYGLQFIRAIAVDQADNIYLAGETLFGSSDTDYITYKLDSSGNVIWYRIYNGVGNSIDQPYAIGVDGSGNVYVTGYSTGTNAQKDIVTIKYSSSGTQQWVAIYDSPEHVHDYAAGMVVTSSGNVYVTGWNEKYDNVTIRYNSSNGSQFWAVVYEDGGTVNAITHDLSSNIIITGSTLTIKYTSTGALIWAEPTGGNTYRDVAVDTAGNVYVTGSGDHDFKTAKYNSAGVEQWVKTYDGGYGWDYAKKVQLDSNANVYVAGFVNAENNYRDCGSIKYDTDGNELWVRTYNGGGNRDDWTEALLVDNAGNVYITGYSIDQQHSATCLTLKYDTAGNLQWDENYIAYNDGFDIITAMGLDNAGNVYVTGLSQQGGTYDYATIKYDTNGNQLWLKTYGDYSSDFAYGIQVDAAGNAYVVGSSSPNGCAVIKYDTDGSELWTSPFDDPAYSSEVCNGIAISADHLYIGGSASTNVSSEYNDYLVVKYDIDGNFQWSANYNGPSNGEDTAYFVAADTVGNVYITGKSWDNNSGYDYATVKYDNKGTQVWIARYNGASNGDDEAVPIVVDSSGNVYVTGYSTDDIGAKDYLTIKYDTDGKEVWIARYNGASNGDDEAYSLAVDAVGNVYVTGRSWDNASGYDAVTVMYDSDGNQRWEARYSGPGAGEDYGQTVALDNYGFAYVSGVTTNNYGNQDIVVLRYDAQGTLLWETTYNGTSNQDDFPTYKMAIDSEGGVFVAGGSMNDTTGYDYITIKYRQSASLVAAKPQVDDSSGSFPNAIIEPDELVGLIGQVANIGGGMAVSTEGTLSTSDPLLIIDAHAAYPDLLPGEAGTCSECYSAITFSAYRPALHWDITVTEEPTCASCLNASYDFTYHIGNSFSDVPPTNIFYAYIETLLHNGVTSGCTASQYCPAMLVQRQHMAKFVCQSMQVAQPGSCAASACSGIFEDVTPANPFCALIEALYSAGAVTGCSSSPMLYCPALYTQRQGMAKIVCTAMEITTPGSCTTAPCTGIFTDVDISNPFCPFIEALYNAGVVSGCAPSLFCPNAAISRDQQAKFLVKAFDFIM